MLALGCDHGGYDLKQEIIAYLKEAGIAFQDFGTYDKESCDYPVFGEAVARAVSEGRCEGGLLFCGTGIGISLAANRVEGIRAVVCSEPYSAKMSRMHNNANVLCLGGRVVGPGLAREIVELWLRTEFEGGRHQDRVAMLDGISR